jgi:acetoin utilization deacetylase AcuC-like enzyme
LGAARPAASHPHASWLSLGVYAYKVDPISFFRLDSPECLCARWRMGRMGLPTVFRMEGGYSIEQTGINTVKVLRGFEDA